MNKVCNKCELNKPIEEYYFRKDSGRYRTSCKECSKIAFKAHHEKAYLSKIKPRKAIYTKEPENIDRHRTWRLNYERHKRATDPLFKLKKNLRTRILKALQQNSKWGSTVRDLGCSIAEFKAYLESKWKPGMTWDNHALLGWHIDHIVPLSKFDLSDKEQFLKAVHYTNMQPLWCYENWAKHAKEA